MFVDLIFNEVLQRYEASYPSTGTAVVIGSSLLGGGLFANPTITGQILGADGTSALPFYSFTADPALGFWRSGSSVITLQGSLTVTSSVNASGDIRAGAASSIYWTSQSILKSPVNGKINVQNQASTIGVELKFDALPTISSGFGTSPAVTAGSTALAGSIDVGTGGVATSGVILWNGTAFPSAPFIAVTCSLGAVPTVAVTTTSQVTFTTSVAWPASTKVSWICISARA